MTWRSLNEKHDSMLVNKAFVALIYSVSGCFFFEKNYDEIITQKNQYIDVIHNVCRTVGFVTSFQLKTKAAKKHREKKMQNLKS